ncbi:rod-binding protein [Pelagibacterium montanilacus]|uniref:rod-binding protein n=1 Tax=Pelagibacterium montanilacus TaxID=2185280 RepID=UPI000F8D613A|nr:rod-binding protein [Pelagibacterium montanilacus]
MAVALDTLQGAGARAPERLDPLRQQAQELEGVFLNTLVSEMFKGLETESMFGGGHAEEQWRGLQAEHLASEMARSGGIGIADQIVATLLQSQEHNAGSTSPATAIGAYTR